MARRRLTLAQPRGQRAMIPVRILGTAGALPGRAVPTSEVCEAGWPGRDPGELIERTGIHTRHWADADTTHAALAAETLARALEAARLPADRLERLIFVDCTGGDRLLPATANAVAAALGLRGSCDCLDLNNSCTGFLSAFDLAARCVATGMGPVGIVVTELWSRHLSVEDRRTWAVFGDAAAAAVVGPGRPGEGLLSSFLRNDGALRGSVTLAHAGLTKQPEHVRFGVSNKQLGQEATDAVLLSAKEALARAELDLDEVEWVLVHQPNGRLYRGIVEALGVGEERLVTVVGEIGSVGAASLPYSLDRLLRSGRVRPGHRILMLAVGSGISFGGLLYRVAP